jgi:hypothetical protein
MSALNLLLLFSLVSPALCHSMEMKIVKRARLSWPLGQGKTLNTSAITPAAIPVITTINENGTDTFLSDKSLLKIVQDSATKTSQLVQIHQSLASHSKPKQLCFARIMLDTLVISACKQLQESYFSVLIDVELAEKERKQQLTSIVATITANVKNAFNKEHNQQREDRELPEATQFPSYATNEFLQELITTIINSDLG